MAIYTGFFDAVFDEDTGTYTNEYDSSDFVGYFENIIGSGVCVNGNDNSMKVSYSAAAKAITIAQGYLFIDGYWLKNDGEYTLGAANSIQGVYAVCATLDIGSLTIKLEQKPKADPESYPNSLVLAYVTVGQGGAVSVEDTRSRTDICGIVDSAGSLSKKVEYAINYIDTEIVAKLEQVEKDLDAKSKEIDGKLQEANDVIAKIAPPAIGSIKFSAADTSEEGWLKCDGSFISESEYPELVAALGKIYPSGDRFELLNTEGVIGDKLSNSVLYENTLWVYSTINSTLIGINLNGGEVKTIPVTSDSPKWGSFIPNTDANPVCLSIVSNKVSAGAKLFIAQTIKSGSYYTGNADGDDLTKSLLIFFADFQPDIDSEIAMGMAVETIATRPTSEKDYYQISPNICSPYVISKLIEGEEIYFCLAGGSYMGSSPLVYHPLVWKADSKEAFYFIGGSSNPMNQVKYSNKSLKGWNGQRLGYSQVNEDEAVLIYLYTSSTSSTTYRESAPLGIYDSSVSGKLLMVNSTEKSFAVAGKTGAAYLSNRTDGIFSIDVVNRRVANLSISELIPSMATTFVDAACYLHEKEVYMFFVGTGIVFFREYEQNSIGYLDTTSVLGTITQYASMRYSKDEGTLYIVGQDTTNTIRAAKIVLNTLFDYSSEGAWLPNMSQDGIPAYIKAKEVGEA